MSPAPTVSAIIAVRDGAGRVAEAVRSVRAQTAPVLELIVVDDGSADDTADVVAQADPAAILVRQAASGPARARNAGAVAAAGEFLAFLDHDDLWPPGRTAALLAAMTPATEYLCGRIQIEAWQCAPDPRLMAASGRHMPFLPSSGLIRRSLWHRLGGMDPAHDRAEDTDLYLRIREAGVQPVLVDAVTLIYRQHGGNRSRQIEASQQALLCALQGSAARRRSSG